MKAIHMQHPKEMYLLALTEMCQRFAFWGVAYLLVLFLVQYHHLPDPKADQIFGLFTGAAFVLPLLGGYLADRVGYKTSVLFGSIVTAAACFLLSLGSENVIYISLALFVIGGSLFTPSIYSLLGRVYTQKQEIREGGFSIYYAMVNCGTFVAMLVLGYIGQLGYWSVVFIIAGCVQLLGLLPFWNVMQLPLLKNSALSLDTQKKSSNLHKHEKRRIIAIVVLSFFSIFFWTPYNQGGSSMNLFALRYTDRTIMGFEIPPSWLLSLESLYLVLFAVPLALLYKFLVKKKMDPTPPMKCALSLFSIGLCFAIMTIGSMFIPAHASQAMLSPSYLVIAYVWMALGEMLICPIGLSLITHLSPHRFTAFLVGLWYFCIGIAFYLGGTLAGYMNQLKSLSDFFMIFVLMTLIPAIILLTLCKKLDRMRHLESL